MKKLALLVLLAINAFICGNICGEGIQSTENSDDDRDVIVGEVKIEKDKDGKIIKVTVTCVNKDEDEEGDVVIYLVNLDEKGIELGRENSEKEAEVVGTITRKEKGEDVELWIKVLSFEETKTDTTPQD
ncbi:MAG: hypothetical protein A2020_07625 [Lentisphaerae bacterium GWF2_45_14]|nr:MAG: hypothetical protein A2020_07625 [Lentisphaerae bacterium GWF2_45_14]